MDIDWNYLNCNKFTKMTIIKFIATSILVLLFNSGCIITNTPGFYSGFKKIKEPFKSSVQFINNGDKVPMKNDGKTLYAISGQSLLNSIRNEDTTLLYFWSPLCHSSICISIQSAQEYCDNKNINLIVIPEYYDTLAFDRLADNINTKIFMINHKYYKTDYCPKYTRLFIEDLDKEKLLNKKEKYNRFYVFKGNTLIEARDNIFD